METGKIQNLECLYSEYMEWSGKSWGGHSEGGVNREKGLLAVVVVVVHGSTEVKADLLSIYPFSKGNRSSLT